MVAALARLSRKTLASVPSSLRPLLSRGFPLSSSSETAAAHPAASPPPPASSPATSGDRVRWDYRGQRQIIPLGQWVPKIAVDAFVAPNAVLAGQVTIYDAASVWYGSVLRGDLNKITLGFSSNVQERCVLHAAWSSPTGNNGVTYMQVITIKIPGLPAETSVDRYVTIGGYCLLRSCTIEPECIIGQHSVLMEGSLVETNSILEAGSVLPPGRRIPTGELWAGNPARFVRKLTHEETLEIPKLAVAINDLMQSHFSEFLPYSTAYLEVEKLKKAFNIPL
ncbi:Gamma carbonic anhydrase-like 2, mitochondrial [Ananas comosus]|uniref:Gamma carbonic anhydrase-like 2, mitochondrial n=1 Tax=Ananas comosus TaxID=4615 RepID=A0A199VED8_ANACO|nr:Gamma carbonic anhydrase-like 2, mitochondrial [Ananas comosus]